MTKGRHGAGIGALEVVPEKVFDFDSFLQMLEQSNGEPSDLIKGIFRRQDSFTQGQILQVLEERYPEAARILREKISATESGRGEKPVADQVTDTGISVAQIYDQAVQDL